MKKDIEFPDNNDLQLAIAPSEYEQWDVYLMNRGTSTINKILVSSSGYGIDSEGHKISTSTLRHFYDELGSGNNIFVEKIDPSVFHLNNEYWISYWIGETLYDRKFLYVPGSITIDNCIFVSILEKEAVLHA